METPPNNAKIWEDHVTSIQEDKILLKTVSSYKKIEWKTISDKVTESVNKLKTPKQCRDRWLNYVNPSLKNEKLSEDDFQKLFSLQMKFGSKWSKISKEFPEKSQNLLKNSFYSTVRRNIRRFNKNKTDSERIRGPIHRLLLVPEIRSILEAGKFLTNQEFFCRTLSTEALCLIQTMNQSISTMNDDDDYEMNVDHFFSFSSPTEH